MLSLEQWWAGGTRVRVELPSTKAGTKSTSFEIFCRVEGEGSWLTLLHGFPTCSWDWAQLRDKLITSHRLLIFDFLGYGDSDKPHKHHYSTFEHADITEALWQHFGIKETAIVGHDVGSTVTQELLARQLEKKSDTRITAAIFMNGAVFTEAYKPVLITRLMQKPVLGGIIAGLLSEKTFSKNISALFHPSHPIAATDLHDYWQALIRRDGRKNIPRLLHYIPEKKTYKKRWEGIFDQTSIPLRFLWGMADPATGTVIACSIRQHLPQADLVEFSEVGHYPQIEIPQQVAAEILKMRVKV